MREGECWSVLVGSKESRARGRRVRSEAGDRDCCLDVGFRLGEGEVSERVDECSGLALTRTHTGTGPQPNLLLQAFVPHSCGHTISTSNRLTSSTTYAPPPRPLPRPSSAFACVRQPQNHHQLTSTLAIDNPPPQSLSHPQNKSQATTLEDGRCYYYHPFGCPEGRSRGYRQALWKVEH